MLLENNDEIGKDCSPAAPDKPIACKVETYNGRCAFEDGGWRRDGACHNKEVLWSVTGCCNYRCRHCFMSAPNARFCEPGREELLRIVRQISDCGIGTVALTGGEPLVSPYLFDAIAELKKLGIGLSMLHTNGSLVTEQFLDRLEGAGCTRLFRSALTASAGTTG